MKREYYFDTLEEAEKRARKILLENRKSDSPKLRTTRVEKEGSFISIEDEEERNIVFIFAFKEGHFLFMLSEEEQSPKNYTYPFRCLEKEKLVYPVIAGALFYKPPKALTPEEALSQKGAEELYSFLFGTNGEFCTSREKVAALTKEKLFSSPDFPLTGINIEPLPSVLSEVTGIDAGSEEGYVKAIEKLLRQEISEEEKAVTRYAFSKLSAALFLQYATYEFARTEDYEHLQETLLKFPLFGLGKEWYSFIEYRVPSPPSTAETDILSRYLGTIIRAEVCMIVGLRDITEVTGAPYTELLRAERAQVWI